MKKLLIALGVLCILAVTVYVRSYWEWMKVEKETSGVARESVEAVSAGWQKADFKKYEDSLQNIFMVNGAQKASLDESLPLYGTLGKRKTQAVCRMEDYTAYKAVPEDYIAANYTCRAGFENAVADIRVSVRRLTSKGPWKMSYFDVRSPLLAGGKEAQKAKKQENPNISEPEESSWDRYRNMLPSIPSFSR